MIRGKILAYNRTKTYISKKRRKNIMEERNNVMENETIVAANYAETNDLPAVTDGSFELSEIHSEGRTNTIGKGLVLAAGVGIGILAAKKAAPKVKEFIKKREDDKRLKKYMKEHRDVILDSIKSMEDDDYYADFTEVDDEDVTEESEPEEKKEEKTEKTETEKK